MSKQGTSLSRSQGQAAPNRGSTGLFERSPPFGRHVCIQRDAAGPAIEADAPDQVRSVVESPGTPLDSATRETMEPRFGYDFSQVRVHADDRAAESARAVGAHAYTAGSHVVFASGQPSPGSVAGDRLMAHELTHVVQQSQGPVAGTPIGGGFDVSDPGDAYERNARESATSLPASGRSFETQNVSGLETLRQSSAPHQIQRSDQDSPLQTAAAQQSASASQESATAAKASAITGGIYGGIGAITGVLGAFAAIRSANFAERSAQAAEDPPVAEPTTGGISVTDADIPEIKGVDKFKDPSKDELQLNADPESVTKTTETETTKGQDVATSTGTDVERTQGEGASAKKITSRGGTTKTTPAEKTRTSEAKLFKPLDDKDQTQTWRLLTVSQGKDNQASFYMTLRTAGKDIKDGGTEPGDAVGYLGGTMEANTAITFKARPGAHADDGSASVRMLIGGSNTPPRKMMQESGFFGGGGPKFNENYTVQRFRAAVNFSANAATAPAVEAKTLKVGVGTITQGSGKPDGNDALVNVDLPNAVGAGVDSPGKKKKK
ncbi:hypothetical protein LMG28688_05779 [Paraburkholderia caffeinitolerans]|uniref:eCIS core domain-containing protein n=1 Tax=Paraburkholderia caffeinitolerans TaxID=1723730 RepID=A0A6J5GPR5_9BURK|nr:DUF4157 domain-containing protein [Paraburkholderia caffeinitolerans]CAB3803395.1 hypothetical protein LMG28688_05779 [Paraburkholderia caffeinitolerans]